MLRILAAASGSSTSRKANAHDPGPWRGSAGKTCGEDFIERDWKELEQRRATG
jgi:hypothetical protein